MKIHVCLYLDDQEVLNINDVICLSFHEDHLTIVDFYNKHLFTYDKFNKIEVDHVTFYFMPRINEHIFNITMY